MTNFNNMPKIELHLHLDGSLDIDSIKNRYGLTLEELNNKMIADKKCKNLDDYLTKFDFPISIMQTKEELEIAVIELLNKLKNQNVIYAEIRFAPQFHTKKGLSQEEVVKTVLDAKEKVSIKSNFILCFMRGKDNMNYNYETLEVAKKFYKKGVCAVDLAGSEALYKTDSYKELFDKVKEYNIPFTIHAGEAAGPESIKSAISFGATRIGHGVRCIEDLDLINYIKEKNIILEICPTSNIQTCVCDNYSNHPIQKLYDENVKVTINTDNMTVSNINLSMEYENIVKNTNITLDDIIKMNINSINAAFISNEEKQLLLEEFNKKL